VTTHREHERHALRVFAWIAAVVALAALCWFGSAYLVHSDATRRIDREIARLRAAGDPTTVGEAWGPPPKAEENGYALLEEAGKMLVDSESPDAKGFVAVEAWLASSEGRATCGESIATDPVERKRWIQRTARPTLGDDEAPEVEWTACAAGARSAWLATYADGLEAVHAAADRRVLWPPGNVIGPVRTAGGILRLSALVALDAGDGTRARDELRRILALALALEAKPSFGRMSQRRILQQEVLLVLHALADAGRLAPELAELEPDLARAATWPMLVPAAHVERANQIASRFTSVGSVPTNWRSRVSRWVRRDLVARDQRSFADELLDLGDALEVLRRAPAEAIAEIPKLELRTREARTVSTAAFALRHGESSARHDFLLVLARAALRARVGGAEAAQDFLATQCNPFTGLAPTVRVEPDGTIVIEALTASTTTPPETAGETRLRTWRVRR
jgi:hypothetical protein